MDFKPLFEPNGITIIGASRSPSKVGSIILKNLRITYKGNIYPINPYAEELQGLKTYKRTSNVPASIDLAIIVVPADSVLDVLKDCERKRIKFAIIISAGFREIGQAGKKREEELERFLEKAKIKVVGPNCLGIVATSPNINSTFMDPNIKPLAGSTALVSQSGALLSAMVDDATVNGIGFSKIISIGNSVGVDESDFLEFLADDEKTAAIALYIEGVRDGKKFLDSLTKAVAKKPVIVIKGGKTPEGAIAAESHTGALVGDYKAYELAFNRAGAITVDNLDDLFNFLRDAPRLKVKSNEIIIVTNAGGGGVLTADAIKRTRLHLAKLSDKVNGELQKMLPREASIKNPIDILGDATPDRYREVLAQLLRMDKPTIAVFAPQERAMPIETAKEMYEAHMLSPDTPLLPVFIGGATVERARSLFMDKKMPFFNYPNEAVDVLNGLYHYHRHRLQEYTLYNKTKAKQVKVTLKENLFGLKGKLLFDKIGVPTAKGMAITNDKQLKDAAQKIGFPCVLKIASNRIAHKSEVDGVAVGIKSIDELKKSFETMSERVRKDRLDVKGYELYEDLKKNGEGALELLIGAHRDGLFGPILVIGLGGVYANTLKETHSFLAPISDGDITRFKSSRIGKMLSEACKPQVYNEIISYIIKLAKFMEDNVSIKDIDLNPVFVFRDAAIASDFKLFV